MKRILTSRLRWVDAGIPAWLSLAVIPAAAVLLWAPASRPATVAAPVTWGCDGQFKTCQTVIYGGRHYETVYLPGTNSQGSPVDEYFYPFLLDGAPVMQDGERLWNKLARVHDGYPHAGYWHVEWQREGTRWVQRWHRVHDVVPLGPTTYPNAPRHPQALDNAARQAQAPAGSTTAGNTAPATSRAFDVGAKEQLPPADNRAAYLVQRFCSWPLEPQVTRWFPNGQTFAVVEASVYEAYVKSEEARRLPYTLEESIKWGGGPMPMRLARAHMENALRRGEACAPPIRLNLPPAGSGQQINRPPLPPSMRSTEPYGQGK